MKLGSQYGCGEQLNCRMFITLFSYFSMAATTRTHIRGVTWHRDNDTILWQWWDTMTRTGKTLCDSGMTLWYDLYNSGTLWRPEDTMTRHLYRRVCGVRWHVYDMKSSVWHKWHDTSDMRWQYVKVYWPTHLYCYIHPSSLVLRILWWAMGILSFDSFCTCGSCKNRHKIHQYQNYKWCLILTKVFKIFE